MPLRFLSRQSCWGYGSQDSENGASSISGQAILLGVFSQMCRKVGHFCKSALPRSTKVDTHKDFLIIKQWCCSFTLVGNSRVTEPSTFTCLNFVRVGKVVLGIRGTDVACGDC